MVFAIDIRRRLVPATLDDEANKDSRSVAFSAMFAGSSSR